MKKVFAMAVAVTLVSLVAVTGALAASFTVTTESGVRVSEKGVCEQIGSSTMDQATAADVWTAGTVITIELLAGATICTDVDYDAGDYIVTAVAGADFFTVEVVTDNYPGPIVYGDVNSRICFDLSNTDYNSTNNQTVEVTYRDTANNTYSGDFVVATVKPSAHAIDICTKDQRENAFIPGGYNQKTGVPVIPLCVEQGQSQEVGGCGTSALSICIYITDASSQFNGSDYNFTLKTDKPGVGISYVQAWRNNPAAALQQLVVTENERRDSNGSVVQGTECEDLANTAEIDFDVAMQGSGGVILQVGVAFNTLAGASPGSLLMDVAFNRIPCGDSASIQNLKVADLVVCGGDETSASLLFPYAPEISGIWWCGFALTNLSDATVTVTLEAYEEDGDRYDGSVTIAPHGIYADQAQNLPLTTESEDAAFADERFWIKAYGTGPIDGLMFFGNGYEGMGYIPRTTGIF